MGVNRGRRVRCLAAALPTGWLCAYCGARTRPDVSNGHPLRATREHVVPKAAGGRHLRGNLVIACLRCNQLAGRYVDPWLAGLAKARP